MFPTWCNHFASKSTEPSRSFFFLIGFPSCLCLLQITLCCVLCYLPNTALVALSPFQIPTGSLSLAFPLSAPLPWLSRLCCSVFFPHLLYLTPALVQVDYFLVLDRVTTHSYLKPFAHSIPSVLPSQSAGTLFSLQSSLKVQSFNLINLCNCLMALRVLAFIVVIRVLISGPFPPHQLRAVPLRAWLCYSSCTNALVGSGIELNSQ